MEALFSLVGADRAQLDPVSTQHDYETFPRENPALPETDSSVGNDAIRPIKIINSCPDNGGKNTNF